MLNNKDNNIIKYVRIYNYNNIIILLKYYLQVQ